jgi:hypothetical protein
MMNPNQVYRFRLAGHTTLSIASGVVNNFIACDPSAAGSNFPEWATLSSLFSEFKLVEFGVDIMRNFIGGESKIAPLMIATNLGTAVNPGSYANLADNAYVKWYSYVNNEKTSMRIVLKGNSLGWSEVTTPTVSPYAGAPGSIQFYSNYSTGGSFIDAFHLIVWGIYDFTIRV